MPTYIVSKTKCITTSGSSGGGGGSTCKDTVKFFGSLAAKLLDMAETIEKRIDKIKNEIYNPSKGFLLAQIDAPRMVIGVRYEYVEYIKRFGPPDNGIFDEAKLTALRQELGIDSNAHTI
jgi:hypothetical protein